MRYEGELVAAVAALTPEIAQRAVELIEVDYEPLEIVSDVEAALQPGAPLLHEDWADVRSLRGCRPRRQRLLALDDPQGRS